MESWLRNRPAIAFPNQIFPFNSKNVRIFYHFTLADVKKILKPLVIFVKHFVIAKRWRVGYYKNGCKNIQTVPWKKPVLRIWTKKKDFLAFLTAGRKNVQSAYIYFLWPNWSNNDFSFSCDGPFTNRTVWKPHIHNIEISLKPGKLLLLYHHQN